MKSEEREPPGARDHAGDPGGPAAVADVRAPVIALRREPCGRGRKFRGDSEEVRSLPAVPLGAPVVDGKLLADHDALAVGEGVVEDDAGADTGVDPDLD